jgi:hypothetical protein
MYFEGYIVIYVEGNGLYCDICMYLEGFTCAGIGEQLARGLSDDSLHAGRTFLDIFRPHSHRTPLLGELEAVGDEVAQHLIGGGHGNMVITAIPRDI